MTVASPEAGPTPYADRLALLLQELLTAVVRIRAGREQVPKLEAFRAQVLEAIGLARDSARRKGYSEEQTETAVFAVVAFLDEAVLNSSNPVFRDWPRRPLQEELFKGHVAGETFFQYVRDLLMGDNSQPTADLLEVYQLCLLLGYRGRYGAGNEGNLRAIQDRINEKIQRIRGPIAPLSFQPSGEAPVRDSERWTVALMWGAAGLAVLALVLFLIYGASLGSHLTDLSLGIRDLRFPG